MTTIETALRDARDRFTPISDSPGLDAHMLLGAVLNVERAYLLAHPEATLTPEQRDQFERFVRRHAGGEPIAYILGRRGFYDLEFIVTPDVLIPRPETELLLERALDFAKSRPNVVAVDVGTGSGALAVTFAKHHPTATVYATDMSQPALDIARRNAAANDVLERITFFEGDLLAPLLERRIQVDLVLANLPYVASDELPQLPVSLYEPLLALDGGADGLDLVRRLLAQLPSVWRGEARALLEIGAEQGMAARDLSGALFVALHQDYAGLDRILELQRAPVSG